MGSRSKQAEKEQKEKRCAVNLASDLFVGCPFKRPFTSLASSNSSSQSSLQLPMWSSTQSCQRGGLRGQGRLHRSDHQVLRLRRLLWHPLLPPPLLDYHHHRMQHQVSLCLHRE